MSRRAQTAETDCIFNGISTWTLVVFEDNVRYKREAAVCPPHVLIPSIAAQARYGRLGHNKQRTKEPWMPPRVPDQAERCSVVRPLRENAVPSSSKQSDPPDGKEETSNVDVERACKPVGGLRPPRVSLAATV